MPEYIYRYIHIVINRNIYIATNIYVSGVHVQVSPTLSAYPSVLAVTPRPQTRQSLLCSAHSLNGNDRQSRRRDLGIKGCSRSYRGSVAGLGIENGFCFEIRFYNKKTVSHLTPNPPSNFVIQLSY